MDELLNIPAAVNFDESIAHYEIHAHQPYASSSFNNSDEIRIAVQHQDLCILPSKSSLHIFGRLTKNDGITLTQNVHLSNNAVCFLFDEIRYELNGIEIDRCKYVGHTTIMKNYTSQTSNQLNFIENAGYSKIAADARLTLENGYFDVTIPLNMIFGFAEDYKKIIINAKHELILTRARSDVNADPLISISFRSWEMYEYPLIPTSSKVLWQIKTSTQLEKPRYVIVGFQTARKDKRKKYACHFDHCNIINVKLFLNSQYYPYGNLNLNFDQNQYSLLYEMYANFQSSYYGKDSKPILTKDIFKSLFPLIVIDCSKQNEFLKQASVDVRLEFEAGINMPAETTAYCLIIHDRVIQYKPISGVVKKLL
ncbi:uncharacterized protein LOC122512749 [Leptopilina heterotoma]|uniref:uncharacterized protein LOC122512749 n=1 Tax=Leptopilina heterotoma TaxID=63436 RepID=UPI001CA96E9B|nr:uncharacterized protein LOC122512749 [Leptopilina heterotoma]